MASSKKTLGVRFLCAFAISSLLFQPGWAQDAEQLWQFEVPSSAVPQTVSIGNHGSQVLSASDGHEARVRLFSSFDTNPANSVWEHDLGNDARQVRVASAQRSNRHASIHMMRPPSSSAYHTVVKAYDSNGPTPRWEWTSPTPSGLHTMSSVHVTDDGSRVVAAFLRSSEQYSQVVHFDAGSGAVLASVVFPTFGGFYHSALSGDGRILYLGYSFRSYVVDLQNPQAVATVMTYVSTETGHALSFDGSYFAASGSNLIRVFERNAFGGFSTGFDLSLDGLTVVCRRIAISRNGEILAAGFSLSNNRDIRIAAWNLTSGTKVLDRTLIGGGTFTNIISSLDISGDGSRIAVGTWGDEAGLIPQILLFKTGYSLPYAGFHLPGSAMALSLSEDGSWLAVARKSVHANTFAGGGSIELISARALEVQVVGQPRLGGPPVRIDVTQQPGSNAFVLSNTALEAVPLSFDAGQLFLRRAGLQLTPAQLQDDGTHALSWTFSSSAGNFIGQTVYFQGYSFAPRKLTQNYATVTILP